MKNSEPPESKHKKLHVTKNRKTWFDERQKAKTFGCAWPSKKLPSGDHAEVTPIPPLLDITRSNCNAFLHLSFIYLMCGIKLSFLSKKRPRNLTSYSTGSCCPYSLRLGSGCKPFFYKNVHIKFLWEKI